MLERDLAAILSAEQVLSSAAARSAYDCDAYPLERELPTCIVLPQDTCEVQRVIAYCVQNQLPFTPRGAGTGLSGGATPALGGVVISTKRMRQILEINLEDRWIHVQTGIPNARVTKAVADHGLLFAPDPSSQSVCTIGGNIAENSGGPHTLKYGVTSQHVLKARMVSPDAEVYDLGSLVSGGEELDLLSIVVGSEGTFGIVTEAWLKLTPKPAWIETLLASFSSVREATQVVSDIIASGVVPAALEMMDHGIIHALQIAFQLQFPAHAKALLLIECDGERDETIAEIEQVLRICKQNGAISTEIAQTEQARQSLWTARKKGIGAMGRLAPTILTHDGVIPRSQLPEMLEAVSQICANEQIGVANIFHAGDGNLHPCLYFDDRDPGQVQAAVRAGEAIIEKCLALGGSVTGEHGIGLEKLDLLSRMFNTDDLEFQARLKTVFNPENLCNPCKALPNQKGCVEHRSRSRGAAT